MSPEILSPAFRAGAGAALYNSQGQILLWQRADKPDVWQLQQGGMDPGETPIETLWRELCEETGLTQEQCGVPLEYDRWTVYHFPAEIKRRPGHEHIIGQAHRWFFIYLNDDVAIDLDKAKDKEFLAWRWGTFDELLGPANELKRHVYLELAEYFEQHILPSLTSK